MPETFTPLVWHNDTFPAINETALNRIETGVDAIDIRAARLELGIATAVTVSYASSVTLNATQGALFRCVAPGDLTLDDIVGGTDGQLVVFQVQASGSTIVLHFTGSTDTVSIAAGQWWVGAFRHIAASGTWLLDDGSGGGSAGSGNDLNVLAPQTVPYAATVTLNAATGALFRITAPGDVTLAAPANGSDGQAIVLEVLASGGQRAVTFGVGIIGDPVAIPSGTRWTGTLRYDVGANSWLLSGSNAGAIIIAGDNGLSPMRIRGRKTTTGAPSTGTWAVGDVVMDSAGAWHLCTVSGAPGTWT